VSDISILAEARDAARLIRVRTQFSDQVWSCFVIEVDRDLAVLLMLDEGFHIDGLRALRPGDIAECASPHPLTQFVEEVLAERGEDEIELPALSIESLVTLLETASLHVPLLGIYRDEVDPGRVRMGRMLEVDEETLTLLEIDEQAQWMDEPTAIPIGEITRVDMGGARLEAYYLVSGEPD